MKFLLAGFLIFAVANWCFAAEKAVYFVGNSLTWDANPENFKTAAATQDHPLKIGYHIQCGSPLQRIVETPSTCVTPPAEFGDATTALSNHVWDVVSLQPFYDTLSGGKDAAQTLINRTRSNSGNSTTRILIYAAYPSASYPVGAPTKFDSPGDATIDFRNVWDAPYSDSNRFNRSFYTQLIQSLRNDPANAGVQIDMVPLGDVLYELDARLAANSVAGINSVQQLYRDSAHMGNAGKFIGLSTFYSVIFKEAPDSLPLTVPTDFASAQLSSLIRDTVWDVVSNHPYTSVPEPSSAAVISGALLIGALSRREMRSN